MPALIFLNNYKIIIGLFLVLYVIFRYLHFRGLRKELAFDTFFVFLVTHVLVQKLYYFYLNYQNFPSIMEIIWNTNLAPDAFFLALTTNFIIVYFLSRRFRFSIYHLYDGLTISTVLFTIFYSLDFQNPLQKTDLLLLFGLFAILLVLKRSLISGFFGFSFIFLISSISIIHTFSTNSLIFYIIMNTMNALLIFRRSKYMETQLSKDFIERSKEKLLARREELTREIEDLDHKEARDMGDSDYIDEVMEDLEIENGKINKAFLSKVLEKVNRALKRIEEGKYGYDQKTGEPIEKSRLELFPEAEENTR
jgi:DnaK suppressor protein